MWKMLSFNCVALALAGMDAGCSAEPASSVDPSAATLVIDDTTSRNPGDEDSPRNSRHSVAGSGSVAVRYVVDPSDSAQIAVVSGAQVATPAPASSATTQGAVRRELK
jgi:hypothetical protein